MLVIKDNVSVDHYPKTSATILVYKLNIIVSTPNMLECEKWKCVHIIIIYIIITFEFYLLVNATLKSFSQFLIFFYIKLC